MLHKFSFTTLCVVLCTMAFAQTATITIDATANLKHISPGIYGKNNCLSDDPNKPLSAADWKLLKDAGVQFLRENGGNNATKYNWRRKLSSHPDWYNNVYSHNWDYMAQQLQSNIPDAFGMFAFQLIGKAAANKNNNFGDWNYNNAQWWEGTSQNLAGGGTPNAGGGSKAQKEGNPDLYLMDWGADTTTAILDHWLGESGLELNPEQFVYWNMDNEPEIWSGTHDDVMPVQLTPEEFIQRYFAVAKKARALFPDIKLCGPVTCNEWQWYNWENKPISSGGKKYSWLEFFIKRVAEEQKATGVRLLDVLDLHFYPGESKDADVVQLYRVFFDKTYSYPGANGCKTLNGGWDESLTKEYVFERCRAWLETYMGPDNGVTFGISELGFKDKTASVNAVTYASIMGTFANNGVEILTPWFWHKGMWETIHLFSRYSQELSCSSVSNNENELSAYTSLNSDSITIMVVNRSTSKTYTSETIIKNSSVPDGSYKTLQLKELPNDETFISHSTNALKSGSVSVSNGSFSIVTPPLSITAILLKAVSQVSSQKTTINHDFRAWQGKNGSILFQYYAEQEKEVEVRLFDMYGKTMGNVIQLNCKSGIHQYTIEAGTLSAGLYIIRLTDDRTTAAEKIVLKNK